MALRLTLGILALVFIPLGVVFTIVGLVVDEPDSGSPEAFIYVGAPLALVGIACGVVFLRLWRRERARRARRRAGLRATAEVVAAELNWAVRVNGRPALRLTVRFAGSTVTGTFLAPRTPQDLQPGAAIDVLYDPADPTNFEPAPHGVTSR
jgi:hypothetical protein